MAPLYGRRLAASMTRRVNACDGPSGAACRRRRAEVVIEPADTEWGNHRCRVRDLEGYEWSFGTHRPGEPQDWSADDPG
jgi:uncharacterized glyoxalase superfamily protein PhnB